MASNGLLYVVFYKHLLLLSAGQHLLILGPNLCRQGQPIGMHVILLYCIIGEQTKDLMAMGYTDEAKSIFVTNVIQLLSCRRDILISRLFKPYFCLFSFALLVMLPMDSTFSERCKSQDLRLAVLLQCNL